jgi:hypothetical protein
LRREDISGMIKEFIPYSEALALKELGFEEPWSFVYKKQRIKRLGFAYKNYIDWKDVISAPLYQQAFRWFREKYGLDSYVKHLYKSTIKVAYFFCIDKTDGIEYHSMQGTLDSGYFDTYEEAELACLRKLIELANESI